MGLFTRDRNRPAAIAQRVGALEGELEALRIRFANLSGEVIENLDRASKSRGRAEQAERKRAAAIAGDNGEGVMTEADYRAHLEKGGAVHPATERALGL